MTGYNQSSNDVPLEPSILAAAAPLESILCTEELGRRPSRPPDYENENRALVALVSALADSPRTILQTLADKVLAIMHADSAGLSLLTGNKERFYWAAISGAWGPHIGGGTPRNFGPCGDVLDCNTPMLFTHWERRYPYLGAAVPLADEGLLVPFHVNGEAVGTIWAIAHSTGRKFDAEDLRLLESLGRFASAAYQAVESLEHLKSEIAARDKAEMALRELANGLEVKVQVRTEALRRSEAFLAEAQRLSETGSFCWRVATNEIIWSEELYRIYELEVGVPVTVERIRTRVHPEDISLMERMKMGARAAGDDTAFEWQYRLMMPDRSIKYVHAVAHATQDQDGQLEYIAAVQDVTARRGSEEALDKARSELAHVARVMSFGALTASIAHEVNQPIGAARNNAHAALRFLAGDPPAMAEVREALECVVSDTYRADEIIGRIRDQVTKIPPRREGVDLNNAIEEVVALVRGELSKNRVSVRTQLVEGQSTVHGDRVQLQQVMLNLILNAIEAMISVEDKELVICTESLREEGLIVCVGDSGLGVALEDRERIFDSFYTTKANGMGIGLSICRSIIDAHGGRLWVDANHPCGAVFRISLPRPS